MLITSFSAYSQRYLATADSLMSLTEYQLAALNYEKAYFFSQEKQTKCRALAGKIHALKQLKKFDQIWKRVLKANSNLPDNETTRTIRYEGALAAFLNHEFYQAQEFLDQIETPPQDTIFFVRKTWLNILVLNEQQKWNEASVLFSHLNSFLHLQDTTITYLYEHHPALLSVYKAQQWATFVPGAGQMYAHAVGEGIMATLLQMGTITWLVFELSHTAFLTAYFGAAPLFQKFYTGSIRRSTELARRYNTRQSNTFNTQIQQNIKLLLSGIQNNSIKKK